MNIPHFESGKEYAKALISGIMEAELEVPAESRIPEEILKYFFENIKELCDRNYHDYIIGLIESYILIDEELEKLFNDATVRYIEDTLHGLVDKDMLEISIDEKGDILYGLTPQGEQIAKNLGKDYLDN